MKVIFFLYKTIYINVTFMLKELFIKGVVLRRVLDVEMFVNCLTFHIIYLKFCVCLDNYCNFDQ